MLSAFQQEAPLCSFDPGLDFEQGSRLCNRINPRRGRLARIMPNVPDSLLAVSRAVISSGSIYHMVWI